MRRLVIGFAIALVAAGCRDVRAMAPVPRYGPELQIRPSPAAPYNEVTFGPVRALVPQEWEPVAAAVPGTSQEGFIASPRPRAWAHVDGSVEGMAAVWVDVGRVGVPSDFYYLAATGPAVESLLHSNRCDRTAHEVYVNHRPAFMEGRTSSPGDYVARAHGTCRTEGTLTRWAYFVAAPGYGPVRRVGIPSSGLYVVVAVLKDSARARAQLHELLRSTQFDGATVTDFIHASRA